MLLTLGSSLLVAVPLVVLSARYHVLGTDKVGQDVFYQALKSIRTGLVIGTLTTLVMLPFALLLGHHGRLLPRLGGRCHPVHLHHAQFDSRACC